MESPRPKALAPLLAPLHLPAPRTHLEMRLRPSPVERYLELLKQFENLLNRNRESVISRKLEPLAIEDRYHLVKSNLLDFSLSSLGLSASLRKWICMDKSTF